jgi:hypothetical protein
MPVEIGFDLIRTDCNEMPLPSKADCAVVMLHRIKEAFAFNVDSIMRDRFERRAGSNLSRHIN